MRGGIINRRDVHRCVSLEEDVSQAGALGTSQPSQAQWLAEAKRNREATWPGLLPTPPRTLGALPPWKKEAHPGTVSNKPLRIQPSCQPNCSQAHFHPQTSLHDPAPAITSPRQQQTANSRPVQTSATMEEKHGQCVDAQRRTRTAFPPRSHCTNALHQCIDRLSEACAVQVAWPSTTCQPHAVHHPREPGRFNGPARSAWS